MTPEFRIGIDLGGTKIAAIGLADNDTAGSIKRRATPRGDYDGTIAAIAGLVADIEKSHGQTGTVGIGIPGSISPHSDLIQNANSTWLNGMPLAEDLQRKLQRPVRLANDANCFALSEAYDGAAQGAACVFGVILGTGCGGGIVLNGALHAGGRSIAGEWGHTPLPRASAHEAEGPACWCGRKGCLETWLSGPALARDHAQTTGETLSAEEVRTRADAGDTGARATLERHTERLARGLATVSNILDPDVIVLGGGLSQMAHLYDRLPDLMQPLIFADHAAVNIVPPQHGDASGVRGAARLW